MFSIFTINHILKDTPRPETSEEVVREEPSDTPSAKRKRTSYSDWQVQLLEEFFHKNMYPENESRDKIAKAACIEPEKVKVSGNIIH